MSFTESVRSTELTPFCAGGAFWKKWLDLLSSFRFCSGVRALLTVMKMLFSMVSRFHKRVSSEGWW